MGRRIFVLFLGIILAVFLLEAGLSLTGLIFHDKSNIGNKFIGNIHGKPYVVLCLGNSYTQGGGAPPEMSYPAQLQRIFDQRVKGANVAVINEGVGAQNTAELLSELKFNIRRYRPDLIVLQTGQPNDWNYLKYTVHLRKKESRLSFDKTIRYYFQEFLYKKHIYKLWAMFRYSKLQRLKLSASSGYQNTEKYHKAVEVIKSVVELKASFTANQSEIEEARKLFMSYVRTDPGQPRNYVEIGLIFYMRSEYEESFKYFMKAYDAALACDSREWIITTLKYIRHLRRYLKDVHNNEMSKKLDDFIDQWHLNHHGHVFNLFLLNDFEVSQWVESDVKEAVGIIRQQRVQLIMQNYPVCLPVNSTLLKIAESLKVAFVDNYSVFQKKIAQGTPKEQLFVPDAHCNANGYGVMAENVFDKIMVEGFLKAAEKQ